MRIVHVVNFNLNKAGNAFANCDQKIHAGLCENGHYAYAFPITDLARQLHWSRSKRGGAAAANRALIETCRQIQPDLLLLAHAKILTNETLLQLRNELPKLKIAQWFVDSIAQDSEIDYLRNRLPLLDSFFASTDGEVLKKYDSPQCRAHYLPNPVHRDIERFKSFERKDHDYDLIFIGTDAGGKNKARIQLLTDIQKALPSHFRFGIFGSLGQPRADGANRDRILSRSKAALNLSRFVPRKFYSSDRIAQIMGNGLLACSQADFDLHNLYGDNTLLTYKNPDDLAEKLAKLLTTDEWRTIAEAGWKVNHERFSAKNVAARIIQMTPFDR